MTTAPGPILLPSRHLPRTLLGYVLETRLTRTTPPAAAPGIACPWDIWWVCYRAAIPLASLGVQVAPPPDSCPACARDARDLAAADPPRHPAGRTRPSCGCLLEWAIQMRSPARQAGWPPWSLTLALIKPGAPTARIRQRLEAGHDILATFAPTLTTADTRRLYPEAYGADYVAARDAYLTTGPVTVLILRARAPGTTAATAQIKAGIRRETGASMLRNHLHMPDNPGEAFADIAHFAGPRALAELYERHERARGAGRLAFYRSALGIGAAGARRNAS